MKLSEAQSQQAPKKTLKLSQIAKPVPEGDPATAVYEVGKAMIGGGLETSLGGLKGLVATATSGLDAGVDAVNEGKKAALEYMPQTQQGQRALETIGDLIDAGIDIVNFPISGLAGLGELASGQGLDAAVAMINRVQQDGLGKTMGENAFQRTGSPAVATLAQMTPDVLLGGGAKSVLTPTHIPKSQLFNAATGELTPGFSRALQKKGVMSGTVTPEDVSKLPDVSPRKASNELIVQKIEGGETENYLAPYQVDKKRKVLGGTKAILADDIIAQEAAKQGIPDGDIMAVKSASMPTKVKMLDMLNKHRAIKGNTSKALDFRHTDVIGDSALSRFNFLRQEANKARLELDRLVKSGPTGQSSRLIEGPNTGIRGKQVDLSRIENAFFKGLDELDVKYNKDVYPPTLEFNGSIIQENPASKRLIASVVRLLSGEGAPDAVAAHKLKKQLDDLIDFKKKSKDGLTESGRRFAKGLRHEVNQVIRAISPAYAETNDKLSNILETLDAFDDSMGSSIDLFSPSANKAVGSNLRKLLSNYSNRGEIEDSLLMLDKTAGQYGGKFEESIPELVNFGKILDDHFGPIARGSFQAEIGSAIDGNLVKDVARGNYMDAAIDAGLGKVQEMRGINTDNGYKAIEKLLKR